VVRRATANTLYAPSQTCFDQWVFVVADASNNRYLFTGGPGDLECGGNDGDRAGGFRDFDAGRASRALPTQVWPATGRIYYLGLS
jgi:hypothetical protein